MRALISQRKEKKCHMVRHYGLLCIETAVYSVVAGSRRVTLM